MPHRLERPIIGLVAFAALALCAARPMPDSPSDLVKTTEEMCNRIDAERAPTKTAITTAQAKLDEYHSLLEQEQPWTRANDRERREQAVRLVRSYNTLILIRSADLAHAQSELADIDARYQRCQNSLAAARAIEAQEHERLRDRRDDHSFENIHRLIPETGMAPGDVGTGALAGPPAHGRPGCVLSGGSMAGD